MIKKYIFKDEERLQSDLIAEDRGAILYLYDSMYVSAQKWIGQNGGNIDDAKDVFQESIIVLLNKMKSNDFRTAKGNLRNYFFGIIKFKWFEILKKESKNPQVEFQNDRYSDFEMIAMEDSDEMRLSDIVTKEFNQLKDDCKNLLKLFFVDLFSTKKVGELLGFKEDYVRIKKMRCLQYLRESVINSIEYKHEFK
jgi:RNA polymerase sigma factor (sigma-70 family)